MTEVGHLLADDAVVCVKGRLDLRDEQPKLVCMELKRPDLNARRTEPLHVELPVHALTDERVEPLKRLLERASRRRRRCSSTWAPSASGWPRSASVDTSRGLLGRAAGAARARPAWRCELTDPWSGPETVAVSLRDPA